MWKLYTYPGCSSCRLAEAWLSRAGIDVEKTHIYQSPPDRGELVKIAELLPGGIFDLIATRGMAFRELDLAGKALSPDKWLDLIEKYPRLLRRPILTDGKRALVGWGEARYKQFLET